jgi:hypothetical protein
MSKYAPSANANDGNYFYGVAKAWNTVQILKAAGRKLTRAGLMKAARSMNYGAGSKTACPFCLKGMSIKTKGGDQYPISQMQLVKYTNNVFVPQGGLINGRGK